MAIALKHLAIPGWMLLIAAIFSCGQTQADAVSTDARPGGGLIVNLAADGLVESGLLGTLHQDTSREALLQGFQEMVDRYADTQVSHVFLNANYQRACYPSKVWDTYWDVEKPASQIQGWRRNVWLIHRRDIDLYALCINLFRQRGMSPWVSMRMNDTHYIDDPAAANTFWKEHPEYRCKHLPGFDFSIEAVRRHHLALVEELLERYDVDGIELDWMRFANQHFNRGEGKAGSHHLTDMMRAVRRLAQQAEQRRGHRVQVAARVPAFPDVSLALGMDGVGWVREGLIDLLIVSPLWRPIDTDIPIEAWRDRIGSIAHPYTLAAATDIWLFGAPGGPMMLNNAESMRGFTATMLDRGADQIYLFNHFNPADFKHTIDRPDGSRYIHDEHRTILSEAARLETVLNKPRRHVLTFHDLPPSGAKPALPVMLKPGQMAEFRLPTGPRPSKGKVVVRVGIAEQPGGDVSRASLAVALNGTVCRAVDDLKPHAANLDNPLTGQLAQIVPRVAQFEAPLNSIRRGYNTVRLSLPQGDAQQIVWLEIYLRP